MKKYFTSSFLLIFALSFAQSESINKLDEIVLNGSFSPILNSGYSVQVISDSILTNNYQSLGNLLQNQVNAYIKENGSGMVSSISLRGTNASQTGVYWNGIAINSAMNGQTDFNSIAVNSFDKVEIRKGGGSVLLGSGAIGGAINLSDRIVFQNEKKAHVVTGLGSYQTYNLQVKGLISTDNLFAKVSFGGSRSENDYPYHDSELFNENAAYKNYNINGVFAFKINDNNSLGFYTSIFDNDRNTSRTITAQSNAKLLNFDSRYMLDWKYLGNRFTSSLKIAYLNEKFTYYFDKDLPDSSKSKSNSWIAKYDFTYFLNNEIFFNSGVEFENAIANGNNISSVEQNDLTSYILFHHQPISSLRYNLSIRKGISSIYDIPFTYSFDTQYDISRKIKMKAAFSSNYRLPTFNDLYWEPGGNSDLRSEKSKSAEIGFDFVHQFLKMNITSFYIKSEDMIQWQPVSGTLWEPRNIQDVTNYGVELSIWAQKKFEHHLFLLKLQYDYTMSKDDNLNKQIIYVPNHKANIIFDYQIKKWNFSYNLQYTGEVFTTTSNTQSLNAFWLSNIDFSRNFLKNRLQLAFRINNLLDENYQSVAYRPMPNRNYMLNINLKI